MINAIEYRLKYKRLVPLKYKLYHLFYVMI